MGVLSVTTSRPLGAPLSEVRAQLAALVKPGPLLQWRHVDAFRGTVNESGLELLHGDVVRNSFMPVVKGTFDASTDPAVVHLTLEPHGVMVALIVLWSLLAELAAVSLLLKLDGEPGLFVAGLLAPLLGPVVAVVAFRAGVRTTLERLDALWAARR